jgi:hypothetical protein
MLNIYIYIHTHTRGCKRVISIDKERNYQVERRITKRIKSKPQILIIKKRNE